MVLYLLCDCFGPIIWADFVCRTVSGAGPLAARRGAGAGAWFSLLRARTHGRNFQLSSKVIGQISCLLMSLIITIWSGGLNYDRIQGGWSARGTGGEKTSGVLLDFPYFGGIPAIRQKIFFHIFCMHHHYWTPVGPVFSNSLLLFEHL